MTTENREESSKSAQNHDLDVTKTLKREDYKELAENAAPEEATDPAEKQVTADLDRKNVLEREVVTEKDETKELISGNESKKEVVAGNEEPSGLAGKVISEWVPDQKTPTEGMLRMQAFIESGWMSVNDRIVYKINESAIYWAQVDKYGMLWRERRNPDGTTARGLGYTSPTDFAVAMATEYVKSGGEKLWRNGPGSVNGWEVCKTCKRGAVSLQQLRKDLLRSKKVSQAKQSEHEPVMLPENAQKEVDSSERDGRQEKGSGPVKHSNNVEQSLVKDLNSGGDRKNTPTGSSIPPNGAEGEQTVSSDANFIASSAVSKSPSAVSQEKNGDKVSEEQKRQNAGRDTAPQAEPLKEDTAFVKARNASESMEDNNIRPSDERQSDAHGAKSTRSGSETTKEEHGKVLGKEKDEGSEEQPENSGVEDEEKEQKTVVSTASGRRGDTTKEKSKDSSARMDSGERGDKIEEPEATANLKGVGLDLQNNATRDERGKPAEAIQKDEHTKEETASGSANGISERVEKEHKVKSGGNAILAEAPARTQELASTQMEEASKAKKEEASRAKKEEASKVKKEEASEAKKQSPKRDDALLTIETDHSEDFSVREATKSPPREENISKVKGQSKNDREVERSHSEGSLKDNKTKEGRSVTLTKRKRSDLDTRDSPISTPKRARLRVEPDAALFEDPAAAEAAAVAAAADKAEARRTTRLAAGKIKQVDYNAPITIKRPDSVSAADEANSHADSARASASSTGAEKPRRMRTTRSSRSRPYGDPQVDEETGSRHRGSSGGDTDGDDGGSGERTSKSGSSSSHTASVSPDPSSTPLPTDDQGWNHVAIGILGSVIRSVNSFETGALMPALKLKLDWKAHGKSDSDVGEYVSMLKKRIMDFSPGLFASHVKTSAFLSFLATDMHRLMHESERSESNAVAQVAQERRLRASFDKKRKRAKKELEEVRGRLDNEMENRRESDMQGAYLEVRIADARRTLERERAKREEFSREIEFYERKKVDLVNRIRNTAAMRPEEGLCPSDDTIENHKGELRRLKNVVAESEMELMKSISLAEESRARVDALIREKQRLESEIYISRTGRRLGDRKRRAEPVAKPARKRRRKGIPIKSPCE